MFHVSRREVLRAAAMATTLLPIAGLRRILIRCRISYPRLPGEPAGIFKV
jgi:hypothetical protein